MIESKGVHFSFLFITFISFRTGTDNECWYFLLFVIIINIILKMVLLPYSVFLRASSSWCLEQSWIQRYCKFSFFFPPALTVLDPEMLICKVHLSSVFYLNYFCRHLNRTSLFFVAQVMLSIFQALEGLSILYTLALILKTILDIPVFSFMDEETFRVIQ